MKSLKIKIVAIVALIFIVSGRITESTAQDRLKTMPGYEQYQSVAPQIRSSVKSGALNAKWDESSLIFAYNRDGKSYDYNVKTKQSTETGEAPEQPGRRRRGGPARGRQFAFANSPDGKFKAYTENRNMWISNTDGSYPIAITSDGMRRTFIKLSHYIFVSNVTIVTS